MGNDAEFYERDGKQYVRQSRVLDYFNPPSLVEWKVKNPEAFEVSRAALTVGSRVDALCQQDWMEGSYRLKKAERVEVVNCMAAWERWKKDWPGAFESIAAMQETVFYDDWQAAGTLDVRQSDGITDIKTLGIKNMRYFKPKYLIQCAFYNRAYKLPHRRVLYLDKDCAEYKYEECGENQDYLENLFTGLLVNYRFYNKGEVRGWM